MRRSSPWSRFAEQVTAAGLTPVDRGNYHWQIVGGPLLVNYYPHGKAGPFIYVAGTTGGYRGSVPDAIKATRRPPQAQARRDVRKHSYKRTRRRLMRQRPFCHWCDQALTADTATLDHIIPLYRGGLDNANNYTLACEACNHERGHDMPEIGGDDAPQ